MDDLVEALRRQSIEIANADHYGWGNTMTAAADEIERLLAAIEHMNPGFDVYEAIILFGTKPKSALRELSRLGQEYDAAPNQTEKD